MSDYESRNYDDRGGGRGSRGTRVYVGGLDGGIKKEDLEFEFEKFGKLNSVWVAYNPPGFAFVEFAERRDAEAACDSMNNAEMMGAQLRVEISRGRGRGRGGGRGGRGGFGDRDGFSRGGGGFGDRDGGRGGGFRGGRGGPGGRGRGGRGGSFRGRGGFDDGFRSSRDEGYRSRDGAPGGGGRSYTSNGYPPRDSAPRVSRFRSRSPHRSSSSRGGSGSAGRRDYSADSYGGRPSGGYQRNSYQGGAPY